MFSKAINFLDHSYSRNIIFAFLMGFFCVVLGSMSTALLLASSVVVIFFNARISLKDLWLECKTLSKRIPIILIYPAFYFLAVLTSFNGENWFSDVISIAGSYWQFLVIIPVSVGIYHLSKDANFAGLFSYGCRFGLLFVVPISVLQIYLLNLRPEGIYGNSLVFASLCITGAGLAIIQWPEDKLKDRVISIFTFGAGITAALLTFSRGMLIPIIAVLAIAALYQFKVKSKYKIGMKALTIILICIAGALMTSVYTDNGWRIIDKRIVQPIQKYNSGQEIDRSFSKRLDMQITGFNAFINKPLHGYGIQNVVDEANSISQDVLGRKTSYSYTHLHNDYLTHATGGGIFLLLLFLGVLVSPLIIVRSFSERENEIPLMFFALMIVGAYSTIAMTNVIFHNDQLTTMFCVTVMFLIIRHLQIENGNKQTRIPDFTTIANGVNPLGMK